MNVTTLPDPTRYFEQVSQSSPQAVAPPICLYL